MPRHANTDGGAAYTASPDRPLRVRLQASLLCPPEWTGKHTFYCAAFQTYWDADQRCYFVALFLSLDSDSALRFPSVYWDSVSVTPRSFPA